jgi:hypothetical protein
LVLCLELLIDGPAEADGDPIAAIVEDIVAGDHLVLAVESPVRPVESGCDVALVSCQREQPTVTSSAPYIEDLGGGGLAPDRPIEDGTPPVVPPAVTGSSAAPAGSSSNSRTGESSAPGTAQACLSPWATLDNVLSYGMGTAQSTDCVPSWSDKPLTPPG